MKNFLFAAIAIALPIQISNAVTIIEDFEGEADGVAIGSSNSVFTPSNTEVATFESSNVGLNGSYMRAIDASTTGALRVRTAASADPVGSVSTVSFDFIEPTGGGGDSLRFGFIEGTGSLGSSSTIYNDSNFDDGTIGVDGGSTGGSNVYSLDTAYRLFMILNDSASTISVRGTDIDPNTAGIFLSQNGGVTTIYAGFTNTTGTDTVNGISTGFATTSTWQQEVLIDNYSFQSGVVIPEPSSLLLVSCGSLLVFRRRR